jgi:histidinol-phosphate/aromatic aminotransferase/cobyric acid decarboxylase-like protein
MEGFLKTIDLLESKLLTLLKQKQEQQEYTLKISQENERLREELSKLKQLNSDLEDNFKASKIANTMVGSEDNKLETKQKINSLIRDIDKCIALINE